MTSNEQNSSTQTLEARNDGLIEVLHAESGSCAHKIWQRVFVSAAVQKSFVENRQFAGDESRKLNDILHCLGWFWASFQNDEMLFTAPLTSSETGRSVLQKFRAVYMPDEGIAVMLPDEHALAAAFLSKEPPAQHAESARNHLVCRITPPTIEVISKAEVFIPDTGILAGPRTFGSYHAYDHNHYSMHPSFLSVGLPAIVKETAENATKFAGEQSVLLDAVSRTYATIIEYIRRHEQKAREMASRSSGSERERLLAMAENCRAIAEGPPQNFTQAVQLYWFIYRIRSREHTATIGRLDQHLYPFYRKDIDAGRITRQQALEVLCELWRFFNCGKTINNIMLGGQDRDGNDAVNELSYLMIDAALAVRLPEPFINARVHAGTPAEFISKIAEVQLMGHGQGSVYNDDVLIPALVDYGVPLPIARNYANDGCTEVTIDGESWIEFMHMEALKSLEVTLFNGEENPWIIAARKAGNTPAWGPDKYRPIDDVRLQLGYRTGDVRQMTSFEQVFQAFIDQYLFQTDSVLDMLSARIVHLRTFESSGTVLAGLYPECRQTGNDPLRDGGYKVGCLMVFADNIPHVADCLAAIRKVIFEDRHATMAELLDALEANFEGYDTLRQELLAAPKYGNDDDYVDLISADIVRRMVEHYKKSRSPLGKPYWPALYTDRFTGYAISVGATPDGRRWMEPCTMHYAAVPGRALKGPTALLRSASKAPLGSACGTSPVNVDLPRSIATEDENGRLLLENLIRTSMDLGIAVMTIPIYDNAVLRKAMENPRGHEDVIVRVRGFSMRFVELDRDMQEHIIARTND